MAEWIHNIAIFTKKFSFFSATCNDLDSEGTVVTLSWFDFISVFMLRNFWRIMSESKLKFSFYSHLSSKSWLFQSSIINNSVIWTSWSVDLYLFSDFQTSALCEVSSRIGIQHLQLRAFEPTWSDLTGFVEAASSSLALTSHKPFPLLLHQLLLLLPLLLNFSLPSLSSPSLAGANES